jgi:hypothetical protein
MEQNREPRSKPIPLQSTDLQNSAKNTQWRNDNYGVGKLKIQMKQNETTSQSPKVNSKCIKDWNVRPETIKSKEDKSGNCFRIWEWARNFLIGPQKYRKQKQKIHKWDYILTKEQVLYWKGNSQQNKETAYRLGDNTWKLYIWQRVIIQNIQRTQTTQ